MLQHTFTRAAAVLSTLAFSSMAMAEEVVENPYGLSALWAQGDVVAKATLLILVIMSMGSWYVIFTKLAEQNRVRMAWKPTVLSASSLKKVWRAQASTRACWATSTSTTG